MTTYPNTSADPKKPEGWTATHDEAVRKHARNGEDHDSIAILLETEFPILLNKLSVEWVRKRVEALK